MRGAARLSIRTRLAAVAAVLAMGVTATVAQRTVKPALHGRHWVAITGKPLGATAGAVTFARGGNAVDAAVAISLALGVTRPYSTGLGGGGFLILRTSDGRVVVIDARETAPAAADRDMYVRDGVPERASLAGPLAVATPGLVAGLALALESYGTMSLAEVLSPAIALAGEGFEIGPRHAQMIEFIRRVGLDGADLAVRPGYPVNPSNVATELSPAARAFADASLVVPLLTAPGNMTDPNDPAAERLFAAAGENRVQAIKIGYFRFGGNFRKDLDRARAALAGFAKLAEKHNVRACYHTHSGTYIGSNGGLSKSSLRTICSAWDAIPEKSTKQQIISSATLDFILILRYSVYSDAWEAHSSKLCTSPDHPPQSQ